MSDLRELVERWRVEAHDCDRAGAIIVRTAITECADQLEAALDAAEVPTQPDVCRWECALMADSIKTECGQKADAKMLVQAMSYGGGDCPDCGRKIEEVQGE